MIDRRHILEPVDLQAVRDLLVGAEGIEAEYGCRAKPYVDYLRHHHRRPPPAEATIIGQLIGGRCRADDSIRRLPAAAHESAGQIVNPETQEPDVGAVARADADAFRNLRFGAKAGWFIPCTSGTLADILGAANTPTIGAL